MTNEANPMPEGATPPRLRRGRVSRGLIGVGALIAVLALGAAAGVTGTRLAQRWRPQAVTLLQPKPIGTMKDDTLAAVKGSVAEIFGNKFIVQDDSGRALVDTGPRGEARHIVDKNEPVTVQGRFDNGVIHAQVLVHDDGRSEAFGPPRRPRLPRKSHGQDADRGPGPDDSIAAQGRSVGSLLLPIRPTSTPRV